MGCTTSKDGEDASKIDDGKTTAVSRDLKTAQDVVDFPVFPEGTKSLLMKDLSRQIWH